LLKILKEKRKVEEQQASRKSFMQGQFHSNRMTQENRLHTPYGTVHPCEASHGGDLGSDMMHGRHLALPPGTTHNYGHQPNEGDKGSKETNTAKEGPHNTIEGMQMQGLVSQGMGTSISSLPQEETTRLPDHLMPKPSPKRLYPPLDLSQAPTAKKPSIPFLQQDGQTGSATLQLAPSVLPQDAMGNQDAQENGTGSPVITPTKHEGQPVGKALDSAGGPGIHGAGPPQESAAGGQENRPRT
jgi:hypothetical protein